jgi:hypothetical protein
MVSPSNEQRSRCHGKENQDLCQINEVVERRHRTMKNNGRERENEKTELGGGCPCKGRASEVVPAIQKRNVECLPERP